MHSSDFTEGLGIALWSKTRHRAENADMGAAMYGSASSDGR